MGLLCQRRLLPDLPSLYIDEKAGSDTEGTGAELAPFQTPLKAYQSLQAPATSDANPFAVANFLVRKADSVERNEWVELGKSGQKKLVKGIEIWRKKELKAAQEGDKLAMAKKEQEERDAKRREEAKSVVLVDDASKDAKKVSSAGFSDSAQLMSGQDLPAAGARWPAGQDPGLGPPIPTAGEALLLGAPRWYAVCSGHPDRRLYPHARRP